MTFKFKAWHIYLIGVGLVGFPGVLLLRQFGFETGMGLSYDIESALAETAIIGGIILLIYYAIRRVKKKSENS